MNEPASDSSTLNGGAIAMNESGPEPLIGASGDQERSAEDGSHSAAPSDEEHGFSNKKPEPPEEGPRAPEASDLPTSHVRDPNLSPTLRYGILVYFVATFALLLASDLASGVAAYRKLVNPDDPSQDQTNMILQASIFTSIPKLWSTGSYALTVLIVIASVSWPFVKILLSLYAWCVPYTKAPQRRERMIEVIDALGKWSFVDVVVFSEIVVAFHSTVYLGGPSVQIYIVPRWGLIGFVTANMLSLIGTQFILYRHRTAIYRVQDATGTAEVAAEGKGLRSFGPLSTTHGLVLSGLLVTGFALYLAGCVVLIFSVSNYSRGELVDSTLYSVMNLGQKLTDSAVDGHLGMYVWLQIIWYLLGVALPLLSSALFLVLLWAPLSRSALETLYFVAEVVFAWSSAEVFVLSTIFAVAQIPKFGNGLISAGCTVCFVVQSELLPELSVFVVGAVVHVVASCGCFRAVHKVLYHGRLRYPPQGRPCCSCDPIRSFSRRPSGS